MLYLLREYAYNIHISALIGDLREAKKQPVRPEREYATGLNRAANMSNSVSTNNDIVTTFIDGLLPVKLSKASSFR